MKLFVLCMLVAAVYPLPLDDEGVPTKNISALESRTGNAREATLGEFPWQAYIFIHYFNITHNYNSGSLIHMRWVLTTANNFHFNGSRATHTSIWFGIVDRTNVSGAVFRNSSEYYIHDNFDPENLSNDIALVKLNENVLDTENVRTIMLGSHIYSGSRVEVSGFGRRQDGSASPILHYAELITMTNENCRTVYNYNASISQMCANSNGQATCFDESGSAVVMKQNGVWKQFGVYSGRVGNVCELGIDVFSRISDHRNWIVDEIVSHE